MTRRFHIFPDLIIMGITLLIQIFLSSRLWARPGWQSRTRRLALIGANLVMAALLVMSFLSSFHRVYKYMPSAFAQWLEACGLIIAAGMLGLYLALLIYEQTPKFQP